MVSILLLISNYFSPFTKALGIVLSAPITIAITFMFHSFFSSLVRFMSISFFSFSLVCTLWFVGIARSTIQRVLFVLLINTRSALLTEIRSFVCISKSQRIVCVSFSKTDSDLCKYYLFIWSNLNFLHNSSPPCCIQSCILFLLVCCIRLLWG